MERIETERLVLRTFEKTDLMMMHTYCTNPNIGSNAGWKPHETLEDSKRILKEFMEGDEVWAIEEKENGKVIGSCGLHRDHKRMNDRVRMLGYVLDEPYWGKGYMTEVAKALVAFGFTGMKLDLISVYHFSFNMRSKRVIEKCGFHYDGIMRQARLLYDGRVVDDVCYSMTKEEFFERNER